MLNQSRKFLVVSASVVMSLTISGALAVECVDPAGAGGCFDTIQAAVDAASAGERIDVRPGTYRESVRIPDAKDDIVLRGVPSPITGDDAKPIIHPDIDEEIAEGPGIRVLPGATDVTIRNLEVRKSDFEGILVDVGATGSHIDDVRIFGVRGTCVSISGEGGRLRNSLLEACGSRGVEIGLRPDTSKIPVHRVDECTETGAGRSCPRTDGVTVASNTIDGTGDASIYLYGDDAVVKNNQLYRAAKQGITGWSRNTEILRNDFRQSGDQAIDMSGADVTIRGNSFYDIENECIEFGGPNLKVIDNDFLQCEEEALEVQPRSNNRSSGPDVPDDLLTVDVLVEGNTLRQLGDECIEINGGDGSNRIRDVTLRDNVIEHCEDGGIQLSGVDGALVEDNVISFYQQNGIDANDVIDTIIRNNTLRYGQRGNSQGINFDGDDGRIRGNLVEYTVGDGIEYCGRNPTITGNIVRHSNEPGIKYACGERFVVDDDSEAGDTTGEQSGLVCRQSSPCDGGTIADNEVRFVANEQAFEIFYNAEEDDPRLTVQGNSALDSGDDGFKILGRNVDILDNLARRNGDSQLREGDNGFMVAGVDMLLRGNEATNNREDGFHLCGSELVLENNLARRNLEDGFDVGGDVDSGAEPCFRQLGATGGSTPFPDLVFADADAVTLSGNIANNNNAMGIEISANATVTSSDGNSADGNRTDFCNEGTVSSASGNDFDTTSTDCVID